MPTIRHQACQQTEYCPSRRLPGGGFGYDEADIVDPDASVMVAATPRPYWIYPVPQPGRTFAVMDGATILGFAQNQSSCAPDCPCPADGADGAPGPAGPAGPAGADGADGAPGMLTTQVPSGAFVDASFTIGAVAAGGGPVVGTAPTTLTVTNTAPYPVRYAITAAVTVDIGSNARSQVMTWLDVDDAAGGAFTNAQGTFEANMYNSGSYPERHTRQITYLSDPVAPGATLRARPGTNVTAMTPGSGWGVEAGYRIRAASVLF